MSKFKYNYDVVAYQEESYLSKRLVWELLGNAFRTINNVYIFQNFDEYCKQLKSDNQSDKLAIYWKAASSEKLMDYIKISVAFENYNKAILLRKGFLVHKIRPSFDKSFSSRQRKGLPIKVSDFFKKGFSSIDLFNRDSHIYGVFYENFTTVNYSHTLNDDYQTIIGIDYGLLMELKSINEKRNRLHFFRDSTSAFMVDSHIEKWNYIKNKSIELIGIEFEKAKISLRDEK